MAQLTDAQLWDLTARHFGDLGQNVVNLMFNIAKRESGGNTAAHNNRGEDSRGLFQINIGPGANTDMAGRNLFDPEENARVARVVFDRAGGATPWSTYSAARGDAAYVSPGFQTQVSSMPQLTTDQRMAVMARVAQDLGVPIHQVVWTGDGSIAVMSPVTDEVGDPTGQMKMVAQVWPTGDGTGYTYEPPEKPPAPKQPSYQTSSLPVGYTFDPVSNQFYRDGQPVSAAEVQAAAMAEQTLSRAPTSQQFMVNPRTGDLVVLDPVTGQARTTVPGFDFPQLSPYQTRSDDIAGLREQARQADLGFTSNIYGTQESGRQADNRFSADIYGTQESGRQSDNSLAVNLYGIQDRGAIDRAALGQKDTIDRASIIENARQANLDAMLRQFETRAGLIPQFGDLALRESDAMRQILSQGGDFLYRAFRSQGENSPLPLVTQADLIGHLRNQLGQLDSLVPQKALDIPATQIGAFQIPGAAPAPRPAPMGPAPTPAPMAPAPTAPAFQAPPLVDQYARPWTATTAASGATIQVPDHVPDWVKQGLVSQYAGGTPGFTTERMFMVGEAPPGEPAKGTKPELIANPTGAPIGVEPLTETPKKKKPAGFSGVEKMLKMLMKLADDEGDEKAIPGYSTGTTGLGNSYVMTGNPDWDRMLSQMADTNAGIYQQQAANGYRPPASVPMTQPATPTASAAKPKPTYSAPAQTYRAPALPSIPGFGASYFGAPAPTQQQLIDAGRAALPPAIRAIEQGGAPRQRGFDQALPTLRQLSMLTDEELKAYDTWSRTAYQTPLADIYREVMGRYSPSAAGFTARPSSLIGPGI